MVQGERRRDRVRSHRSSALLGELNPGLAPDVIAHDEARVWSLTRDAGPVLRAIAEPDGLWGCWERLLPWYAEAQLALAEHRSRLLATGVPDLGPTQLPVQYRRLLMELAGRAIEDGGLAPEQARRSGARTARVRPLVRRAGRIANSRQPATR